MYISHLPGSEQDVRELDIMMKSIRRSHMKGTKIAQKHILGTF